MRAVVSVATGPHYVALQDRLCRRMTEVFCGERLCFWRDGWPDEAPPHAHTPYAFKAHALAKVSRQFSTLLWMDSSVVPLAPLEPLWKLIEERGYWFSENTPWNCGEWTCDSALEPLGITREEINLVPHVIGTAFGLDLRQGVAKKFLSELIALAEDGRAFRGPWTNDGGGASIDPSVRGHRHDQAVMSVLAWRMGMELTHPPCWIVDVGTPDERTLLQVCR